MPRKKKPLFSVLVYNFNNYEVLHEIPEGCKNPDAEYIYVTDDKDLKSETWTVVHETRLKGGPFDKTFQVRYNLFRYCHSDICVRFDGSMQLKKDITPVVRRFIDSGCELCVSTHPWRNTMIDEYNAWIITRGYPSEEAAKALSFMYAAGYDVKNYKGLYQLNFLIERNVKAVRFIDSLTYETIKYLGDENDVHRIDQTVYSCIVNTYANALNLRIANIPAAEICTEYFNYYMHGTNEPLSFDFTNALTPYVLNKQV